MFLIYTRVESVLVESLLTVVLNGMYLSGRMGYFNGRSTGRGGGRGFLLGSNVTYGRKLVTPLIVVFYLSNYLTLRDR